MLRPSSWLGWLTAWAAVCLVSGWLANFLNVQMVWWLMTDWLDYWMADLMTCWFDDCCISELMIWVAEWLQTQTQFNVCTWSVVHWPCTWFHCVKMKMPVCAGHSIESKWKHQWFAGHFIESKWTCHGVQVISLSQSETKHCSGLKVQPHSGKHVI